MKRKFLKSQNENLKNDLRDFEVLAEYLTAHLTEDEDGGAETNARWFFDAIKQGCFAHGGIKSVSRCMKVNYKTLWRAVQMTGNPSFIFVLKVIRAMGLQMKIEPIK